MSRPAASRNEPCPCGSGKKYKHCCAGKPRAGAEKLIPWLLAGALALALLWVGVQKIGRGGSSKPPPQRSGQPCEYDARSDMHFDPVHGHWHQGRPPKP